MADFFIDYTAKDYDSLVTQADAFATSILPEWRSRDDNDINWATIKIIAYLVSVAMFYIDLAVNEQDPYEVQIYRNALRVAKRYGMPVNTYVGAMANITCIVATHATLATTFVRGLTEFTTDSGLTYTLIDDLLFPAGVNLKTTDVQYGDWERYQVGLSDGTDYQIFVISRDNVQSDGVRVFVNEGGGFQEWEIRDTLIMSYETDKHCRLVFNEDSYYEIHFGDDQSGKKPLNNSPIEVEIFKMPTGFADLNYGNVAPYNINLCSNVGIISVIQSEAAVGGADRDSIESIGRTLPQWISTANRCVAANDYTYLAKKVAGVSDARCNFDGTIVNVYITPDGGGLAGAPLLAAVNSYLTVRMLPQFTLNVLNPDSLAINVVCSIIVDSRYKQSEIVSYAVVAITSYINDPINFGAYVGIMDAYTAINAIEGVKAGEIVYFYPALEAESLYANILLGPEEQALCSIVTVTATGGIV